MSNTKKLSNQRGDNKKNKKVKKSSYKWLWVALGLIAIVSILIFSGQMSAFTSGKYTPTCRAVQVPYETQEEYLKTEYYFETVPYTDQECEQKELAYSITNFITKENKCLDEKKECDTGFLGIPINCQTFCVDKLVSYSLDLKNLDNEKGGNFNVEFTYYDQATGKTIATSLISNYVYPQTSKIFTSARRVKSEGLDGDAEKSISARYRVNYIPTKEVCRDVIKYREVKREREVTAYRPVTKYKTEQVCD